MKFCKPLLFLFLIIFSFSNSAFSQNLDNELVGSWILNYEKTLDLMDEKAKKHYTEMGAIRQEKVKKAYQNRKLIFEATNRFVQESGGGHKIEGTWFFNNETDIEISTSRGIIRYFKIKKLHGNTLIISSVNHNNDMNMLIAHWHLTKINL
jgi:hypothetical protein